MDAQHGERYRVLTPRQVWEKQNPGKTFREPEVFGQGDTDRDHWSVTINGVEVIDYYGDVLNASENVSYPHGPNVDYRSLEYMNEHGERFELVED